MRTWKAVVLGAAAAATAPLTVPVVLAMARPFVKVVTKQLLVGYELARVKLAFATEELEDVIAEARAEAEDVLSSRRKVSEAAPPNGGAEPMPASRRTSPERPS